MPMEEKYVTYDFIEYEFAMFVELPAAEKWVQERIDQYLQESVSHDPY